MKKIHLWVATDSGGRIYYTGNTKAQVHYFLKQNNFFCRSLKIIKLEGVYK